MKKKKSPFSLQSFIPMVLVFLMCHGCATFRGDKLPELTDWPPPAQSSKKTILLSISGNASANGKVQDFSNLIEDWRTQTVRAYEESGLFSSVVLSSAQPTDLRVDITVDHKGEYSETLAYVTGLTLGVSSLVLPHKSSDDILMRCVVYDKKGQEVGAFQQNESLSTWIQLFLVFAMPFRDGPRKVETNVFYDMNRATILDAYKKGVY